eukprot:3887247-Rhodomonas_salina.1
MHAFMCATTCKSRGGRSGRRREWTGDQCWKTDGFWREGKRFCGCACEDAERGCTNHHHEKEAQESENGAERWHRELDHLDQLSDLDEPQQLRQTDDTNRPQVVKRR